MIETTRFKLTKLAQADRDKHYQLSSSGNVMRYITGKALTRDEATEQFNSFLVENSQHPHFGRYLIEDKQNGELIGAGKISLINENQLEIGYRILEEHWGKGIATEITTRLIAFAMELNETLEIIAYVDSHNIASVRVLEKAGLKKVAGEPQNAYNHIQYVLPTKLSQPGSGSE